MKKTEKIIAAVLCATGFCAVAAFLIYNATFTEVNALSVAPQTIERIIPCVGTVSAKNNEVVTYDETIIPDDIKVSVGDKVSDGDLIMTALNSRMREIDIYSDYDGIITSLPASIGKESKSGTPLAVISLTDKMQVKTQINERDVSVVNIGQSATITGNGFDDKTYYGKVARISSVAEPTASNGTVVSVTVDISNNDEIIMPGMSAKVYISAEETSNVLAVPYSAIAYEGDDAYVYVANGNKTEKTKVEIGVEGDKYAEITSGLEIGDCVIEDKNSIGGRIKVRVKTND